MRFPLQYVRSVVRVPPAEKHWGTENWIGPTAFLQEVVMKIRAPATGTPTVQT